MHTASKTLSVRPSGLLINLAASLGGLLALLSFWPFSSIFAGFGLVATIVISWAVGTYVDFLLVLLGEFILLWLGIAFGAHFIRNRRFR